MDRPLKSSGHLFDFCAVHPNERLLRISQYRLRCEKCLNERVRGLITAVICEGKEKQRRRGFDVE